MTTTIVLEYLKKHGQKMDREIVKDTGINLDIVRKLISELESQKHISCCSVVNYDKGQAIDGILCRVSGYVPPAAPGRKAQPSKVN